MNNNINKEAIDEYINNWREKHPSIVKIKEKEEEYNMLKKQYDSAYKTYLKNVKSGSDKNHQLKYGQNVPGVDHLIEKNKVRYIRIENNFQYIHINELQVYDEFNNNVSENSVIKKIKLTLTLGTGRWDSTRRLNWISFIFNNREVTKRYYLYGKYFVRGQTISIEIPVNFSTTAINGMNYYVGNDGTVIKNIKLDMWDEQTNKWKSLVNKTEKGRGKWVKNRLGRIYFTKQQFKRNENGPDAYASSEAWRGDANKIIDGNHEARAWWPNANSNHTYARENEYIELDLKKNHNLRRIRIWNRPDCCQWRLWNSKMKLLNESRKQVGKTYSLASNRVRDYWINIDNQPKEGRISKSFRRWIGLQECNKLCAEDDECEVALYRPQTYISGKGWTYGNECIHYNSKIKDTEAIGNPDYQYTAYNKPIWEDHENTNYGFDQIKFNDDNSQFKFLGQQSSFSSCKVKATDSDDGPFDSVVYFSDDVKETKWKKHCYGGVMGIDPWGHSNKNKQPQSGVYTSIPPGGQTGQVTVEHINSLNDLLYLNKKLTKLGRDIAELHMKLYKHGEDYDKELKQLNFNIDNKKLKELQDLEIDRKKIMSMKKDINNLTRKEEDNEFVLTTNQYQYILLTIIALALVGLTAHQINKY
jgi:hypothetical protein